MNTPPNETARLLEQLVNLVDGHVLGSMSAKEIRQSYRELDRASTKARAHLATLGAEGEATDTEIVNFIEEERCDWIEFDPGYAGLGHDNATGPEPDEPPSWIIGMKGQVIARKIKFRDAIRAALRASKQEQKP